MDQIDDLLRRFRMHCERPTRTSQEKLQLPVALSFEVLPGRAAAMRRERYLKPVRGHRLRQQIAAECFDLFSGAE